MRSTRGGHAVASPPSSKILAAVPAVPVSGEAVNSYGAAWTAQQMIEAFPDDQAPRYLVRDRDRIYGEYFQHRIQGMGIREVPTAPRSPWQNPYAERVIGSIRRECLNHVIVLGDRQRRRILKSYFRYYHESRTHLSLDKDSPASRPIQPNSWERIVRIAQVGGLHHRYDRRAA